MRAVNLLPPDAYAPKQRLPYAPVVLAATVPVLAGALVFLGYSLEHSNVSDRQISLGVIQSQIVARSPSQAAVSLAGRVLDEKTKRQLEVSDALAKEIPWDDALNQIGRVLPANAWLSGLQASSPQPVASSGPGSAACTITGYTETEADIARVLARLELVPALTNVKLSAASTTLIGTKSVLQFTITANIAKVAA